MNTRLKQFLAAENITQAQFADSINVVRASVSHVLSGRNNPSFDFIKAMMQRYPNLNIDWLMFGKGRMYKDSSAAATEPDIPEDLLFPEIDEEDTPRMQFPVQFEEKAETVVSSNDTKPLNEVVQTIANQRKVSKIIILFDDGTFQEM